MEVKTTSDYFFTIVPFGGMGCGKSTLANFLVDGKDSNWFETSNSTGGGVTWNIKSAKGEALGDKLL